MLEGARSFRRVWGPVPQLVGGRIVVGQVMAGAEVGEGADFPVHVTDLTEKVESPPIAVDGAGGIAQLEVGVPQA